MLFINHNFKSSYHLLRAYYGPATVEGGREFLAFWVFTMILWNELHRRGNWDSENNWESLITYSGTSDRDKIPTHVWMVQGLCSFQNCMLRPSRESSRNLPGSISVWDPKKMIWQVFPGKMKVFHRCHHEAGTVESGIWGDYTILWNYAQVKKADEGKMK